MTGPLALEASTALSPRALFEANALLALEVDAVEALDEAVDAAPSREAALVAALASHERRALDLSEALAELGIEPLFADSPSAFGVHAALAVAARAGDERAVLESAVAFEEMCLSRYEVALGLDLPPDVVAVVDRAIGETRAHVAALKA